MHYNQNVYYNFAKSHNMMQYYNLTTRVIVELTMVLFLSPSIQSFGYATFRYKNLLSNKRLRSSSGELSRICSGSFCATSHDTITSSQSHKVGIILPENNECTTRNA